MIPLRTPAPLKKFPTRLLVTVIVCLILTLLFSGTVSSADTPLVRVLVSFFILPSWPLGLLFLWYLWIFFPSYYLREGRVLALDILMPLISLIVVVVFHRFQIEAAWSFVLILMVIGSVMQSLIWETVETLVVGPRIFSIYAVPSYVHLFFFLFYVFLAQLLRPAYGMPGMSIYLVSLVSFLLGFSIRALEAKGLKVARK